MITTATRQVPALGRWSSLSRYLLVAAAVGMVGYRFVNLDLSSFARDEPQFLTASREQVRTGVWLSANPFYGNMGVRYGPAAFWFYGAVQRLFGDDPRTAIVAMGLAISLAHLSYALALTHLFAEGPAFFAVVLAWIASSPYQYYWSRLAWDLTSNVAVTWAVVLLCLCREWRPGAVVVLGLLLGVAFSTHLSVVPFVAAVVLVVARELRARPGRGALALLGAAAGFLVSVPYLLFLARAPVVPRAPREALSLGNWVAWPFEAPKVATTWGLEYILGPSWSDFRDWLGPWASPATFLSGLGLAVCCCGALAGLAVSFSASNPIQRRMSRTALLAWTGSTLLLAALRLERHPHYQFSAAWAPVFGVAACLAWLCLRGPLPRVLALSALGSIALGQFALVVGWMSFIADRGGTRGAPYATSIGGEIAAMRKVCADGAVIVLRNETATYTFPFEYLATTEAACRGKKVLVCSTNPGALSKCNAPGVPGALVRRLTHAYDRGGALRVD